MHGTATMDAVGNSDGADIDLGTRRTLLLVTPGGAILDCLIYALEREFPWLEVEQVPDIQSACASFRHDVQLILVDARFCSDLEAGSTALMLQHPSASAAVMFDDSRKAIGAVNGIFVSELVRGVLPMNLRLDVWLSVVRLMLRGGEYFPASLFHSLVRSPAPAQAARPDVTERFPSAAAATELDDLTEREAQVLEKVARGYQNKVIAAELNLSEHTIKVHLHNIITKLRAHNRTEAAAIFHARRAALATTDQASA